MHDYLASEILNTQHETNHLLREILHALRHNVTSGTISQGDLMQLATPGSTLGFTVTPSPANATVLTDASVWTSSDPTNAPVTGNGLSASVTLAADAPVGGAFTLTWVYTNADGTTATATIAETVIAPVIDVTGGTIEQTA